MVVNKKVTELSELSWWTYDGSSTEQAVTGNSEIYLKPVAVFPDPLRKGCHSLLVLCETYLMDKVTPAKYNYRYLASQIFKDAKEHDPWFGVE